MAQTSQCQWHEHPSVLGSGRGGLWFQANVMSVCVCECICAYKPLGWGLWDSAATGLGLQPDDPVSRLFNAASRLLLLSIRACRAASLLKPISMMSLRARSSTCVQEKMMKNNTENIISVMIYEKVQKKPKRVQAAFVLPWNCRDATQN